MGFWDVSGTSWTTMQTICTSLQIDNHTNTSSLNFYRLNALSDAQPMVSKHWRQLCLGILYNSIYDTVLIQQLCCQKKWTVDWWLNNRLYLMVCTAMHSDNYSPFAITNDLAWQWTFIRNRKITKPVPLDAHVSNCRCWRSYENNTFFFTLLCKLGIFWQKSIARMNRLYLTRYI